MKIYASLLRDGNDLCDAVRFLMFMKLIFLGAKLDSASRDTVVSKQIESEPNETTETNDDESNFSIAAEVVRNLRL